MGKSIVSGLTHYEFLTTGDGSPSICMSSDLYRPEAMHHREGALSESLFVYHGLLVEALALDCPPRVLSVGLGCAYNEMIAAATFLKLGLPLEEIYIESFEGDVPLRETFRYWLLSDSPTSSENPSVSLEPTVDVELHTELIANLEKVLSSVARHFEIAEDALKIWMKTLYQNQRLVLREWLTEDTSFAVPFGAVFFDAFSGKSTPAVWNEEFLVQFLAKAASPRCGLATYAATGTLNRALKRTGFERRDQKGFAFKRQSTRAFKIHHR
jgi:hypothetical protein